MESDAVEDRESMEYTNIVFRLLKSNPVTLIDKATQMGRLASSSSTGQVGKTRKVGDW